MVKTLDLLTFHDALAVVRQKADDRSRSFHTSALVLPLMEALGRTLAEDLLSPCALPPFDNSQMDGFLIESRKVAHASVEQPLRLLVKGALAAGDGSVELESGHAYEIMTGAMIPPGHGYDAVIKVENAHIIEDAQGRWLCVTEPQESGQFVRLKGCDFYLGQCVAAAGSQVSPELVMACAALGIDEVKVQRPIRFALLTTGTELQHFTQHDLQKGSIRDASGPYLAALLRDPRFELVLQKLIPDEPELFKEEVKHALELQADVILSTGAVSMGRHDFVKESLAELGAKVLFHKVAMRPGKPILFAEWTSDAEMPIFFGLPGNPISTLVGWRFFVSSFVGRLAGRKDEVPHEARLMHPFPKPGGFLCVFKANVEAGDGELQVKILEGQGSHLISPLLQANAWAVLPAAEESVEAGALIATYPLHASPY